MLTVLGVVLGVPTVIFKGIRSVREVKAREGTGGGTTMRAGELRRMIADAVAEAAEPLERRVETLEAIVTDEAPTSRLGGRLDQGVLRDVFEDDEADREASDPARVRA